MADPLVLDANGGKRVSAAVGYVAFALVLGWALWTFEPVGRAVARWGSLAVVFMAGLKAISMVLTISPSFRADDAGVYLIPVLGSRIFFRWDQIAEIVVVKTPKSVSVVFRTKRDAVFQRGDRTGAKGVIEISFLDAEMPLRVFIDKIRAFQGAAPLIKTAIESDSAAA